MCSPLVTLAVVRRSCVTGPGPHTCSRGLWNGLTRRTISFSGKTLARTLGPGEDSTRLQRYRNLYDRCGLFTLPLDGLLWDPAYQLIRSLLLGSRTIERGELGVVEARTIVVCPDANAAYRTLPTDHPLASLGVDSVESLMNSLLRDPSRFGIVSQKLLMQPILSSGVPLAWAEYHAARYDWTAPRAEGKETRR
jgi:hypothetical protein